MSRIGFRIGVEVRRNISAGFPNKGRECILPIDLMG